MIFCNPNAGFAEYFQYQSDWLDYYIHMGINVFVWNYRGFSLSEGQPDPKVCAYIIFHFTFWLSKKVPDCDYKTLNERSKLIVIYFCC